MFVRLWVVGLAALTAVVAGGIVWQQTQQHTLPSLDEILEVPNLADILQLQRTVSTPPPLRGPLGQATTTLTRAGVFTETNRHRQENGVAALTGSALLNQAAEAKLQDMVQRQYFDHVGPDGKGPADWVEGVGYEYLRVGENLALGNFGTDAALVQAWMDSPGHRENILNAKFSEIGIAVAPGTYEGARTWFAVQTFAAPLSSCPTPNAEQQARFEAIQTQTNQLNETLKTSAAAIDQAENELRTQLSRLDDLVEQAKQTAQAGNDQIKEGNRVYQQTGSREEAQPYWDKGERLQAEAKALYEQAEQLQTAYNQDVETLQALQRSYNEEVAKLDALAAEGKSLSATINQQIKKFNACLEG